MRLLSYRFCDPWQSSQVRGGWKPDSFPGKGPADRLFGYQRIEAFDHAMALKRSFSPNCHDWWTRIRAIRSKTPFAPLRADGRKSLAASRSTCICPLLPAKGYDFANFCADPGDQSPLPQHPGRLPETAHLSFPDGFRVCPKRSHLFTQRSQTASATRFHAFLTAFTQESGRIFPAPPP